MMSRRRLKLSLAAVSAICILIATAMESVSTGFAMFAILLSLVAALGAVICAKLSSQTFRTQASRAIMADAALIGVLPVATIGLLALGNAEPNPHGGVVLGIILWVPISELCALILMIAVGIRTLRLRNRPKEY